MSPMCKLVLAIHSTLTPCFRRKMASRVFQIADRASHDELMEQAHGSGRPTVLYVSNSSLPGCKVFTPRFEALARERFDVSFFQVEYSRNTHDLFKFSPNQLPVLVLVKGHWARTIMGANYDELVEGVKGMLGGGSV